MLHFKRFCQESRIRSVSTWFQLARNVATSRAKAAIDTMVVQDFGGEDAWQFSLEDSRVDWAQWWYVFEDRLRVKAACDVVNNTSSLASH